MASQCTNVRTVKEDEFGLRKFDRRCSGLGEGPTKNGNQGGKSSTVTHFGMYFYRAMHYVHSAVLRSYVVCPSVCPSECDVQVW